MRRGIVGFILVLLVFVLTSTSYAEEQYQTEIATTYRRSDSWDNKLYTAFGTELADSRTVAYGLTGEVFFVPVNTEGHLFEEAAFLERAGSAAFDFEQVQQVFGILEGTGPGRQLMANFAKSGFPFAVQVSFEDSKIHYTVGSSGDLNSKKYGIKIGEYFTNGLLAGFGFERSNIIDTTSPYWIMNENVRGGELFLKYVRELEKGRGIKLETKNVVSRTHDLFHNEITSSALSVSIVYYWSQAVSTGIGYQHTNSELSWPGRVTTDTGLLNSTGTVYTGSMSYFISPRVSIKGNYDRFLASWRGSGGDSNSYNISLAARF